MVKLEWKVNGRTVPSNRIADELGKSIRQRRDRQGEARDRGRSLPGPRRRRQQHPSRERRKQDELHLQRVLRRPEGGDRDAPALVHGPKTSLTGSSTVSITTTSRSGRVIGSWFMLVLMSGTFFASSRDFSIRVKSTHARRSSACQTVPRTISSVTRSRMIASFLRQDR